MPNGTASSRTKSLTLTALSLILSQGLWGQIQTGRISGTIYDPNKAVVPNATVTVSNKATNVAQKIVSNETGGYVSSRAQSGALRRRCHRSRFPHYGSIRG